MNKKFRIPHSAIRTVFVQSVGVLKLGRKQSYKNLTVFALLSDYAANLDYLTLDEALAKDLIEVKEVSQGGSVPELTLKFLSTPPNFQAKNCNDRNLKPLLQGNNSV